MSTVNKRVLDSSLRKPQPMLNPQVKKTDLGSPLPPSRLGLCRHIKGNNYLLLREAWGQDTLGQVHTQTFRSRNEQWAWFSLSLESV